MDSVDYEKILNLDYKQVAEICKINPELKNKIFSSAYKQRLKTDIKLIAICGSVGKTTTKEMLILIFKEWCNSDNYAYSLDNKNTKLALALQVLKLTENIKYGVFEVGAGKPRDLATVFDFLIPQVAVLLNIGKAHVAEFENLQQLINEKTSILLNKNVKNLVVCGDDERIMTVARQSSQKTIKFGIKEFNDVQLVSEKNNIVKLKTNNEHIEFELAVNAYGHGLNVAAAVAAAMVYYVPIDVIKKALTNFSGVSRRFEICRYNNTLIIDDAFNASPESMRLGLLKVQELYANKKILLVLGSMLELGSHSIDEHRMIGLEINNVFKNYIINNQLELILIGAEANEIRHALKLPNQFIHFFHTALEAKSSINKIVNNYEVVYFKASKGIGLGHLLLK